MTKTGRTDEERRAAREHYYSGWKPENLAIKLAGAEIDRAALTAKVAELESLIGDAGFARYNANMNEISTLNAEKEKLIEENEKLKDSWDCSPVIQDYVAAIRDGVEKLHEDSIKRAATGDAYCYKKVLALPGFHVKGKEMRE
jgi:hypothetical protein